MLVSVGAIVWVKVGMVVGVSDAIRSIGSTLTTVEVGVISDTPGMLHAERDKTRRNKKDKVILRVIAILCSKKYEV
jgi:hypothetical protein